MVPVAPSPLRYDGLYTSSECFVGTSTKIILPLSVSVDRLCMVVGKVVGAPVHLKTFPGQNLVRKRSHGFDTIEVPVPFDPDRPSSRDNPWHVAFSGARADHPRTESPAGSGELSHGYLAFTDQAGTAHRWFFHQETEDEDHKLLSPGSHGLAVAVGRRLVRFFGGKLKEADTRAEPEFDLRVSNARAIFPAKKRHQTSDDRWYQFHNALNAEPVLSAKELAEAIDQHGGNEDHHALRKSLETYERKLALEAVAVAERSDRSSFPRSSPKI